MEKEQEEKIAEIMADMQCSESFKCYKSQPADTCKTANMGIGGFARCLEGQTGCEFSLSFGSIYLCKCPLRVYLTNTLDV
ncbi:MAG: hypothetical protein KAS75_01710 [Planctomycetes bacterium]|nr:hypothetical protein [Planctomycetota bacterium]